MATRKLKQSKLAGYFVCFDSDSSTQIMCVKEKKIKIDIDNLGSELSTPALVNDNNNVKVNLLSEQDDNTPSSGSTANVSNISEDLEPMIR